MKTVGWTLLALLVLILATEMAEAQMAAPSTKPQPAPVVSQPQKSLPAVSGPASGSASASASGAPALSESVDKNKCTDIANSEKLVREEIVKRIRETVKAGAHPAIAYEEVGSKATATARMDQRVARQADTLAGALFAAVKNPTRPANAASERISGNPNRRATLEMFARCSEQDHKPRKVADNSTNFTGGKTCSTGQVQDIGLNTQQVWQTDFSVEKVKTRFARAKVSSTPDNAVKACTGSRAACSNPETTYRDLTASNFSPAEGKDYFFEDTTSVDTGYFGIKVPMSNRTVTRSTPIEVCGAKVYLVSSVNNGNTRGFDHSSMLGLIASVGGKTLVIGDLSAQAISPAGLTPERLKIPLHFVEEDSVEKVMKAVLTTGYTSVSEVIGSSERPVLGEIGGFPYPQKARPGVDAARRVSVQ